MFVEGNGPAVKEMGCEAGRRATRGDVLASEGTGPGPGLGFRMRTAGTAGKAERTDAIRCVAALGGAWKGSGRR